ncbi:tetratricopeptide repeat protein [Sansalvadorimonas verongulae]|uniref:tetratricopeptide repeat protein n=1 Tax=Sansalvadorimonas verongulae TaxID=2172824 RepID=UPI0012BD4B3D|nr:hypothetical protein [Sansalvadorimonas verongulae]MTI15563.1 hypothetical protein [Sansalvadorimonas verongulae]
MSPGLKSRQSAKEADEAPANEALLKAADNHAGLIKLYKTRLTQATTPEENKTCRLQLGETYLATGDPESTLFILEPLLTEAQRDAGVWLLKSRADLAMGQPDNALDDIDKALFFVAPNSQEHATMLNQQGLAYASLGQYNKARASINQARAAMFDDLVIKNNLAMLDILEQKYEAAINRLMPLYTSGQADERIKANLTIALVRAGLYNEFKMVYSEAKSEQERLSLFMALSSAKIEKPTPAFRK